jgi:iron uptake system component EfeO
MPESTNGPAGKPGQAIRYVLFASAALVVAAAGAFVYALGRPPERSADEAVAIEIAKGGVCRPADLSVPAGRVTFEIVNTSDRPVEWEILDGVMVVEERENIMPGYRSRLSARLVAGSYDITCGFLTGPRGKLTVTPSTSTGTAKVVVPPRAFIAALSEWRVTLGRDGAALERETTKLGAAIGAGDLEASETAFLAARAAYKRMEVVMGRLADLEAEIDPAASTLPAGASDPAYVGFGPIGDGLIGAGKLDGLGPLSSRLAVAATTLKGRVRALTLLPADIATLSGQEARRLAEAAPAVDPALELAELGAALESLGRSVAWLTPIVTPVDAALADRLGTTLGAARAALPRLNEPAERQRLADGLEALADAFSAVNPALGLE